MSTHKLLLILAAVPLAGWLLPVAAGPAVVGYGAYLIGRRLITGQWPEGPNTPPPEQRDERLALTYMVVTNGWDRCDLPGAD